jgi:hypothetical protein
MIELDEDFDADSRELCSDGSCVGVIGADGRCKVCGRPGSAAPRREPAPSTSAAASVDAGGAAGEAVAAGADARDASGDEDGAFDDERQLCPDGGCVGLIGADGKCKVCGRSAAS